MKDDFSLTSFKLWLESDWQRFGHQKTFPFLREPDRPFQQYAKSFIQSDIEDYGLEDSQYEPEKLYHVTTNLSAVKASQQLKSRAQLGAKAIGLGGGATNMSPRAVSLTYNLGRAKEIYEGMKFVAEIIANKVPASQIYDYLSGQNDNRFFDEEELSHFDQALNWYVPKKYILNGDEDKIKAILNKKIKTARDKYEFLQELEKAVVEDNLPEDNPEYAHFDPVIGFTADFSQVQHLRPENIAIIQVVIRKDADVEHYQQEAEIRVSPNDLAIVRYFQP